MYYGSSTPSAAELSELRRRRQARQPLRQHLTELLRHPNTALSDIAHERSWLPGGVLLLGGWVLSGVALGATGLPGLAHGVAGAFQGAVVAPIAGFVAFVIVSFVFHRLAIILEGIGSYVELTSALLFALLPVYLLVPAAALRLIPGSAGGLAFFAASVLIGGWIIRLTYLSVREAHRFSGTQAVLSILGSVLGAVLLTMLMFFVAAFAVLGFG